MSAIERDERSGGAREAAKHGRSLPSGLRRCGSPPHLRIRSRQRCPICQQSAGHATRCTQGQHPDRRAVACDSRQRLRIRWSPPEREWWNSGKPAPSKSSASRPVKRASGDSPKREEIDRLPYPDLEVSGRVRVWLAWRSPLARAALRLHRQTAREAGQAASRGHPDWSASPSRHGIGSQRGKRTQPGSRRKPREAPETRVVREPRSPPNNW